MSVYAVTTNIYFFNALPRTICFVRKKAVVTHMRVDEKLWDKGWYFAVSAGVFGNVINSSTSSKCGARNAIRFKEQLNKKKLLAIAFPLYYMQGGCRKEKKTQGKKIHKQCEIYLNW